MPLGLTAKAALPVGHAASVAVYCTWMERTVTGWKSPKRSGPSSMVAPCLITPRVTVPATTVPTPGTLNTESTVASPGPSGKGRPSGPIGAVLAAESIPAPAPVPVPAPPAPATAAAPAPPLCPSTAVVAAAAAPVAALASASAPPAEAEAAPVPASAADVPVPALSAAPAPAAAAVAAGSLNPGFSASARPPPRGPGVATPEPRAARADTRAGSAASRPLSRPMPSPVTALTQKTGVTRSVRMLRAAVTTWSSDRICTSMGRGTEAAEQGLSISMATAARSPEAVPPCIRRRRCSRTAHMSSSAAATVTHVDGQLARLAQHLGHSVHGLRVHVGRRHVDFGHHHDQRQAQRRRDADVLQPARARGSACTGQDAGESAAVQLATRKRTGDS